MQTLKVAWHHRDKEEQSQRFWGWSSDVTMSRIQGSGRNLGICMQYPLQWRARVHAGRKPARSLCRISGRLMRSLGLKGGLLQMSSAPPVFLGESVTHSQEMGVCLWHTGDCAEDGKHISPTCAGMHPISSQWWCMCDEKARSAGSDFKIPSVLFSNTLFIHFFCISLSKGRTG